MYFLFCSKLSGTNHSTPFPLFLDFQKNNSSTKLIKQQEGSTEFEEIKHIMIAKSNFKKATSEQFQCQPEVPAARPATNSYRRLSPFLPNHTMKQPPPPSSSDAVRFNPDEKPPAPTFPIGDADRPQATDPPPTSLYRIRPPNRIGTEKLPCGIYSAALFLWIR